MPPGLKKRLTKTTTSSADEPPNMPSPALPGQFIKHSKGSGLWRSWTRSFNSPLLALLDLFDNAVDATIDHTKRTAGAGAASAWSPQNPPLIKAYGDPYEKTGLVLKNSCADNIPSLAHVLQPFNSDKSQSMIGENGVGVKQACASLSNLSFILTKSGDRVELGILMAELQINGEGIVAPHATLDTEDDIHERLSSMAADYPTVFGAAFTRYGNGVLEDGIDHLMRHIKSLGESQWKNIDNVFCVILADLRNSGGTGINEEDVAGVANDQTDNNKSRTNKLLKVLGEQLPMKYLHLNEIKVYINSRQIDFKYWERRLVELTEFQVCVDPRKEWSDSDDWMDDEDPEKQQMRVFIGFNPYLNIVKNNHGCGCPLYIHSRWSGRLIKQYRDGRPFLNLPFSGSVYSQGLTVILDDYNGTLPLNPTKQDLSFGLETYGDTHQRNVFSWVEGIAHFFWTFHCEKYGSTVAKELLKNQVDGCLQKVKRLEHASNDDLADLSLGDFISVDKIRWLKVKQSGHAKIRCRKQDREKCIIIRGNDTTVMLRDAEVLQKASAPAKKRKATTVPQSPETATSRSDRSQRQRTAPLRGGKTPNVEASYQRSARRSTAPSYRDESSSSDTSDDERLPAYPRKSVVTPTRQRQVSSSDEKEDIARLRSIVTSTNAELAKTKQSYASLEKEHSTLQNEHFDLQQEHSALEKDHGTLQDLHAEVVDRAARREAKIKRMRMERNNIRKELEAERAASAPAVPDPVASQNVGAVNVKEEAGTAALNNESATSEQLRAALKSERRISRSKDLEISGLQQQLNALRERLGETDTQYRRVIRQVAPNQEIIEID